jgi:hypothetical protein
MVAEGEAEEGSGAEGAASGTRAAEGEGEEMSRGVAGLVEGGLVTEEGEVGAAEVGTTKVGVVQVGCMAVKERRGTGRRRMPQCLGQEQPTLTGIHKEGGGRDPCWRIRRHTLQVSWSRVPVYVARGYARCSTRVLYFCKAAHPAAWQQTTWCSEYVCSLHTLT